MLTECAKILISENELKEQIKVVADKITADYKGEEVLFVGILKGCIHFYSDLTLGVQPCAFQHMAQPHCHCAEHIDALDPVHILILSQFYFQLIFYLPFFSYFNIDKIRFISSSPYL